MARFRNLPVIPQLQAEVTAILSGATYGVYSDKGCTKSIATLTTNANGNTDTVELRAATYYVKETKAPKGFRLDKNVYTMTVKVNETTTLKVSDTPKVTDTLVELFKIDMETSKATPQGNAFLEGAEFVWKYYDGYYTKDNLPSEPTRTWTTLYTYLVSYGKLNAIFSN